MTLLSPGGLLRTARPGSDQIAGSGQTQFSSPGGTADADDAAVSVVPPGLRTSGCVKPRQWIAGLFSEVPTGQCMRKRWDTPKNWYARPQGEISVAGVYAISVL